MHSNSKNAYARQYSRVVYGSIRVGFRTKPRCSVLKLEQLNQTDRLVSTNLNQSEIVNVMARLLSNALFKSIARAPETHSLRTMVPGSFMRYSTTEPSDQDTHDDFKPTDKVSEVPLSARNILENPELKNAVRGFSHWPTFPQIFINGEFIGGSDIILSMHQSGELKDKLIHLLPKVNEEE
ncbi:hypothetical protein IFM89_018001 [Coptis chinensis]|uniref:Glutaredoxin domain-containing protein n=1 Tax=Coptis chinensis TaxID=261450 RepID=A0A835HWI9_9MAGN|nr:hypothetical protein IFM89_018001 [Coptis chinensis]